jgi:hypothetical protein
MENETRRVEPESIICSYRYYSIISKGTLLEPRGTYKLLHFGAIKLSLLSGIHDFLFQLLDLYKRFKICHDNISC